jgi:hypothetical protein
METTMRSVLGVMNLSTPKWLRHPTEIAASRRPLVRNFEFLNQATSDSATITSIWRAVDHCENA